MAAAAAAAEGELKDVDLDDGAGDDGAEGDTAALLRPERGPGSGDGGDGAPPAEAVAIESFEIAMGAGRRKRRLYEGGAAARAWAYVAQLAEHPVGLWILVPTEVWERFSYYGMRALLVLYMNNVLFRPGAWQGVWGMRLITRGYGEPADDMDPEERRKLVQAIASNVYGLYTALVYLTTLPGGYLSDQYFGQKRMIVAGGVTMALGHFSLAFHNAFFLGLFLIIVGNGCFKPNVSTQVGRLYGAGDGRRTTAFFIFYCGINLGAFLSPLVCGELRQEVGYDAGFAAAGFGMLLGLVIYLAGQKHLPPDREKEKSQATGKRMSFAEQVRENRPRVLAIVAVCVLAVPFWGVYEQQGNTIAVYGDKMVNRRIGGWEMPTEFLQSINPFLIFLLTPLLNALWAWQRKRNREPAPTTKMALGLFLLGLGYLLLALLTAEEGGHRLSILWIVVCMALYTTGELFLSPIGLTFVSAESPPSMTSLLMGCWFLSSFFGNYTAGWLGSFYPYLSHRGFFFMLTLIAGTAGVVMFVVGRLAVRMLPAR